MIFVGKNVLNFASFFGYAQVDISTMLEEAVQYVKFLRLQIKVITKKNSNIIDYGKFNFC